MVQPIVYSLSADAAAVASALPPAGLLQLARLAPNAAVAATTPNVFSHRCISIPFSNRRVPGPASVLQTGDFVIIQGSPAARRRPPARRRICGRRAPGTARRRSLAGDGA